MNAFQAALLFLRSLILHILYYQWVRPNGLVASKVIYGFIDLEDYSPHGVAAFLIHPETNDSDLLLWGPFGYNSFFYGRDSWGRVSAAQLELPENWKLKELLVVYPTKDILLVGVRSFGGWHPWPLSNPNNFVLVLKER